MGLGSGKLLTDIMLKRETGIDSKAYLPNRFDTDFGSGPMQVKNITQVENL